MINFKTFHEGKGSGAINYGDVTEALFAAAVASMIAFNKIDKSKINKQRTKIDVKSSTPIKLSDNVSFSIRLKGDNVKGTPIFGKGINLNDQEIIKRLNIIEGYLPKVKSISEILKIRDENEDAIFTVIADGVTGEQSGGTEKGDVKLIIRAKGKNINKDINFSLKSGSKTLANLSPIDGLNAFRKMIGMSELKREKYTIEFVKVIEKTFAEMTPHLKKLLKADNNSKEKKVIKGLFDYLKASAFGTDEADIIDIGKSSIKEIKKTNVDALVKKVNLDVKQSGKTIKFFDTISGKELFQLRLKLRYTDVKVKELKFYIEAGKLMYM